MLEIDSQIPIDLIQVLQEINIKTNHIEVLNKDILGIKTLTKNQERVLIKLTKEQDKLIPRLDKYLPNGNS